MKPEFGNEKHIKLLELSAKYNGMKAITWTPCPCSCDLCAELVALCPHCNGTFDYDDGNVIEPECPHCNHKLIPPTVARQIKELKEEANKL